MTARLGLKLVVDVRERGLHQLLQRTPFTKACLHLGDAQIRNQDNDIVAIFERKTWNDLSSSIKDGRYREQLHRLSTTGLNPNRVVYVVEGNPDHLSVFSLPAQTLHAATISISQRYGFSVWHTPSCQGTVEFLENFLRLLPEYLDPENTPTVQDVRFRKSCINTDNIGVYMLAQIPGIGFKTAQLLIARFNTLDGVKVGVTKGELATTTRNADNGRKFGVKCQNVLKEYLLQS